MILLLLKFYIVSSFAFVGCSSPSNNNEARAIGEEHPTAATGNK